MERGGKRAPEVTLKGSLSAGVTLSRVLPGRHLWQGCP